MKYYPGAAQTVKWSGVQFRCLYFDLVKWYIKYLGIRVDESFNQPRGGNAVYFRVFSGDPVHFFDLGIL